MQWFGAYPQLLADHRGAHAEFLIDQIESAVAAYPWRESYRPWPGPNSNAFVAWMAATCPTCAWTCRPPPSAKTTSANHLRRGRWPHLRDAGGSQFRATQLGNDRVDCRRRVAARLLAALARPTASHHDADVEGRAIHPVEEVDLDPGLPSHPPQLGEERCGAVSRPAD